MVVLMIVPSGKKRLIVCAEGVAQERLHQDPNDSFMKFKFI